MVNCIGCGITIQTFDKDKLGYSPIENSKYCQRCYKIIHYDNLVAVTKEFDNFEILKSIDNTNALIVWVVDILDFEANMIDGINRHFFNKDIILVINKRDLLPSQLNNHKLLQFIYKRLNFYGIKVREVVFVANYGKDGKAEIIKVIDHYRNDKDVILMGSANVGKSTLINALANSDITISRYPGTTLELLKVNMDGYNIIDSPGLINKNSMQYQLNSNDLKQVIPSKVKSSVFQVSKNVSFFIGGLVKIDIEVESFSSIVFYVSDRLNILRANFDKADNNFKQNFNKTLKPITDGKYVNKNIKFNSNDFDLVIYGLGFINFKGKFKNINVYIDENIEVMTREAIV